MIRHVATLLMVVMAMALARPADARYASIIVDAKTGKVLHEVNADTRNYPASLTKMMTLYLTFEAIKAGKLKLDAKLKVSRRAAGRAPSKLGLRRGETIMVEDAIRALVTKSANDVATVLAEALGKTEVRFARTMTDKAHDLGMASTNFRNASGLPNRRQLTTARDLVTLAQALYRDFPEFYHYFSEERFSYRGRTYRNHNRLLGHYDGIDGIKTGYIHASGFNVAVSVERSGRRLFGVVMGGRSARARDRLMAKLLDRAFAGTVPDVPEPKPVIAGIPPVPTPKPTMVVASRGPVQGSLLSDGQWAVQVGAFKRYAAAHLTVTRAARRVPALLRRPISIVQGEGDQDELYRARIVGMNESQARAACDRLIKRKMRCVVVDLTDEGNTDTD